MKLNDIKLRRKSWSYDKYVYGNINIGGNSLADLNASDWEILKEPEKLYNLKQIIEIHNTRRGKIKFKRKNWNIWYYIDSNNEFTSCEIAINRAIRSDDIIAEDYIIEFYE